MPDEVFDGFDHALYRDEVIARWGEDAYERGDRWWSALSDDEKETHRRAQAEIAVAYASALGDGKSAASDDVQAITRRHAEWLSRAVQPSKDYLLGLGEMSVSDPRFAANYEKHRPGTAAFVRDAMAIYADRHYA